MKNLVMPEHLEMVGFLLDHTFFGYNTYELKRLPPTDPPLGSSKMKTCHGQLLGHYFLLGVHPLPQPKLQMCILAFRPELDGLPIPQTHGR